MNQQYLTKLANALVNKKREKRAALWDKLLRLGKLSPDSVRRIVSAASDAPGHRWQQWQKLKKIFHMKGHDPGGAISVVSRGRNLQNEAIGAFRQAQAPAKPYAPMEGILERLAELKKAKGKTAPSSQLDKGVFKKQHRGTDPKTDPWGNRRF
jgi:hypothetical protein